MGAISVGVLVTRGARPQSALTYIVARAIRDAGLLSARDLEGRGVKERTSRQRATLQRLLKGQVPFADAFARSFVSDKYGAATTHWTKLAERVARGVGNPCPLLLVGLPLAVISDYSAASDAL